MGYGKSGSRAVSRSYVRSFSHIESHVVRAKRDGERWDIPHRPLLILIRFFVFLSPSLVFFFVCVVVAHICVYRKEREESVSQSGPLGYTLCDYLFSFMSSYRPHWCHALAAWCAVNLAAAALALAACPIWNRKRRGKKKYPSWNKERGLCVWVFTGWNGRSVGSV